MRGAGFLVGAAAGGELSLDPRPRRFQRGEPLALGSPLGAVSRDFGLGRGEAGRIGGSETVALGGERGKPRRDLFAAAAQGAPRLLGEAMRGLGGHQRLRRALRLLLGCGERRFRLGEHRLQFREPRLICRRLFRKPRLLRAKPGEARLGIGDEARGVRLIAADLLLLRRDGGEARLGRLQLALRLIEEETVALARAAPLRRLLAHAGETVLGLPLLGAGGLHRRRRGFSLGAAGGETFHRLGDRPLRLAP